ncbi:PREDICTED: uncharacterized protein LOC109117137 [Tarenaya hassleriana]|uniref:uncharacterized protein LOC109117137 n=1 Tax=Tarenaya hassleriana TaxID=28532 RepID=UPI0008FD0D95|nr:PREDICTED: uncharacterized protein LOC109117137 [Tarenaya hassleriana]
MSFVTQVTVLWRFLPSAGSATTHRSSKTLNRKQRSRSMASFARRAVSIAQFPSRRIPTQTPSITQRRGLAGAADHHGPPKVNFWQAPMNPAQWKEEHFVLISLSGWGLLFYGGYKFFTGGKNKKEEKAVEATK